MQQQDDFMKLYEEYMDEDEIQSIIEADEMEELQELQGKVNKSTKKKNIDALSISITDYVTQYLGYGYTPSIEVPASEIKRVDKLDKKVNREYDKETKAYKYQKKMIADDQFLSEQDSDYYKKETELKKNKMIASLGQKERINVKYKPNVYSLGEPKFQTLYHRGLKDLNSPLVIGVDNDEGDKNLDALYTGELLQVIDARGNLGTYLNPQHIVSLLTKEEDEEELKELDQLLEEVTEKVDQFNGRGINDLSLLMDYYKCLYSYAEFKTRAAELKRKLAADRKFETLVSHLGKEKKIRRIKENK
jgi:hypothetical protein